MRYAIKLSGATAAIATLASCGGLAGNGATHVPATASTDVGSVETISDEPITLGAPYTVDATTYTPLDTPQYDEVGYAGSHAAEFAGRPTANGETYNPAGASAAHKTLPIPSYVEVTALDSGRTILVRINDRGPLSNDRLIDLSAGAARQLGIEPANIVGVRVRRVNPPEQEKSVLRQGMVTAERIETPEPLLKVLRDKLAKQPRPASAVQKQVAVVSKTSGMETAVSPDDGRLARERGSTPKPKASARPEPVTLGEYVAQIGAFSSRARADALARKAGGLVTPTGDGRLFRVRLGPFATEAQAATAARQKGYPQARVYRD
jgi:rare lipoprotein A